MRVKVRGKQRKVFDIRAAIEASKRDKEKKDSSLQRGPLLIVQGKLEVPS